MNNQPIISSAILIEKNRKLILVKENQEWTLPVGRIKLNEGFEECARRNAIERLGLKLKQVKFLGFQNFPNPFKEHEIIFLFKAKIEKKTSEVELNWFDKKSLPENITYQTKLFLQGDYYRTKNKVKQLQRQFP